jgi:hypothetical protein
MTLEQKQTQLERNTVIGLFALAVAFLAAAARSTAVHLEWLATDAAAARVLQVIWIIGLALFGLAFAWISLLGRQLNPRERAALGDELQVVLSWRSAISAYVVTFVMALIIASVPSTERLPGNAVAAAIVGVGVATLAIQRLRSNPS